MGKASFHRLLWVTAFLLALPALAACGVSEVTAEPTPTPTLPPPYVITLGELGISSSPRPLVCAPTGGTATLPQEFDACWFSWGKSRVTVALEGNSLHLAVAPTTKEAGRFIPDTDHVQQVTFRLEENRGVILGHAEGEQGPRFIATASGAWMKGEAGWEPFRLPPGMRVAVVSAGPEGVSTPQPIDLNDQPASFLIQALTNPEPSSLSLSPGAPTEAVAVWTPEGTLVDEKELARRYKNHLVFSDGKRVFVVPVNYFSGYGINPAEADPRLLSAILQESGVLSVIQRIEAASLYVAMSEQEGWVFGVTEWGEAFSYQIVRNKNGQWRLKELALPADAGSISRIGFNPSTNEVVCLDQNGQVTQIYNPEKQAWETVAERDFNKALNELAGPLKIDPTQITDNYNELRDNKNYQALMLRDAKGQPAVFVVVRGEYGLAIVDPKTGKEDLTIVHHLVKAAQILNEWDPEFLEKMRQNNIVGIYHHNQTFINYPNYRSTYNFLSNDLSPDMYNWPERNKNGVYGLILFNRNHFGSSSSFFYGNRIDIAIIATLVHENYNIKGVRENTPNPLMNTYKLSVDWLNAHINKIPKNESDLLMMWFNQDKPK